MYIQVILRYKGKRYWLLDRYDWPEFEQARFQWEDNNYACDCNRSLYLQRQCDSRIPELPCGRTIELVSLAPIEKKQRPLSNRRAKAYLRKRYLYPDDWMKVARFESDRPIMRDIIDKWKLQLDSCTGLLLPPAAR